MEETVSLNDFDILGIITLRDVRGIEQYVTPVTRGTQSMFQEYLSRSKEYYNVKTMTELSEEREMLKQQLDNRHTKRNYVILENMLNCSGKVYFKKMENFIKDNTETTEEEMILAKACMEEDVTNILRLLSGQGLIQVDPKLILPGGFQNSEKRVIEMDNKAMLYAFCRSLPEEENVEVLTPGYGSIYLGPFLKAMKGWNYTNLLKSKYIYETMPETKETELRDLISSERIFEKGKKIFLLDDNIGTGQTMEEIKTQLENEGITDISSGAVQYNWINYYRISVGEKQVDKSGNKIRRFNASDYDIISPINYYGHKMCKGAIDMLHASGEDYIRYLTSKSYHIPRYNDLIGAIERGMQYAEMAGVNLSSQYKCRIRKEREVSPLLEEYAQFDDNGELTKEQRATTDRMLGVIKEMLHDQEVLKPTVRE